MVEKKVKRENNSGVRQSSTKSDWQQKTKKETNMNKGKKGNKKDMKIDRKQKVDRKQKDMKVEGENENSALRSVD